MSDKLLIFGAGGHAKVVADIALKMDRWKEIAFLDDQENTKKPMGLHVLGTIKDYHTYIEDYDIFVAIGNNKTRKNIMMTLQSEGVSMPTLIHPRAVIGKQVILACGTVVMGGVVINCCTKIGHGCIINTGATIDHDSVLDDYVHVSPGVHISGTVHIGEGTWLGTGSVVINNIIITSGCKVGAGAVVVKDIHKSGTYVGTPVRRVEG
ncbi:acetyltransferase [Vallitalea pronyensis]|uniref:Acetyltransferase n=1 Tax=Vallitalea pronyensis TaxID=1348613 RepID=A0A8J8MHX6_9FIRM|nr:acetyltransferase [Vallitalea pronyensis]QUI21954.1 acetyltransferase [Vallitalea pronyensis]